VLSLAIAVVAIALPDSINPSLIAAELLVAGGRHPGLKALTFTCAAFAVTLVAGLALALGLGDLILSLLPKPGKVVKYSLITAAGVALAAGGVIVWVRRKSLAAKTPNADEKAGSHGSAVVFGAGIAGIELLTAFPYFAAIALIVGASVSIAAKLALIVLYCLIYTMPLFGIAAVCLVMGERAEAVLRPTVGWVLTRWPAVVGPLAACLGIGLTVYGALRLSSL
jgi:hypothetical protein